MIKINSDIRLTDELERRLMQEAFEEQARFKPGKALKNLFVKLHNATTNNQHKQNTASKPLVEAHRSV